MRSVIESFFNGEFIPSERGPKQHEKEYREECRKAAKAEEALCACLGEMELQLFEEYKTHWQNSCFLEISDKFAHGFSLGMMMAAEAYETIDNS